MTPARGWLALSPHPAAAPRAVAAVDAAAGCSPGGGLTLRYRLYGEPAQLRLPSADVPQRRDGLWQHTCCEAFVALAGDDAYREFNFSPAGDWAAYAFSATRRRDPAADPADAAPPAIAVQRFADRIELVATVPAAALPPPGRWLLGLSVVVEAADGGLSYWALRHPSARPDFHHRDAFALNLNLE